jgi:hypothetical protein
MSVLLASIKDLRLDGISNIYIYTQLHFIQHVADQCRAEKKKSNWFPQWRFYPKLGLMTNLQLKMFSVPFLSGDLCSLCQVMVKWNLRGQMNFARTLAVSSM